LNGEKSAVSLSGWKPVGLFAFGISASFTLALRTAKGRERDRGYHKRVGTATWLLLRVSYVPDASVKTSGLHRRRSHVREWCLQIQKWGRGRLSKECDEADVCGMRTNSHLYYAAELWSKSGVLRVQP
jgi:hypothetical protein